MSRPRRWRRAARHCPQMRIFHKAATSVSPRSSTGGICACAAVAVLRRRGKLDADVAVDLPGGTLQVHWAGADAPVWMTGPAEFVFDGEFAQ